MSKELNIKKYVDIIPTQSMEDNLTIISNTLEYKAKLNEALEEENKIHKDRTALIKSNLKLVADVEKVITETALLEAESTKTKKPLVNSKTGEVYGFKDEYHLPKGITRRKGTTNWEYDEDKIRTLTGDTFFKQSIKVADVKKAIKNGELSNKVISKTTEGKATIILDNLSIKEQIKKETK